MRSVEFFFFDEVQVVEGWEVYVRVSWMKDSMWW